jgi:CheY-like chemotaxis protein
MAHSPVRVLLIDDDRYHLGLVARYLDASEFAVVTANSVTKALAFAREQDFDLVVIDVRMPDEGLFASEDSHAGYETGIPLATAIRLLRPQVKLIALTGSTDPAVQEWFTRDCSVAYLPKPTTRKLLMRRINELLGRPKEPPQTFIVHGRDAMVHELKNFLQNSLRLGEPVVLAERPSLGRTLIEKFEHYARGTDVAFVLMTPDDVGALASATHQEPRARQNVLFELGYFLGYLNRTTGRTILLYKPPLELPSDLSGVAYIDVGLGIAAAAEEIRSALAEWL